MKAREEQSNKVDEGKQVAKDFLATMKQEDADAKV
jgi:hypothetical protein